VCCRRHERVLRSSLSARLAPPGRAPSTRSTPHWAAIFFRWPPRFPQHPAGTIPPRVLRDPHKSCHRPAPQSHQRAARAHPPPTIRLHTAGSDAAQNKPVRKVPRTTPTPQDSQGFLLVHLGAALLFSWVWIAGAQLFRGLFRQQGVEVHFLDAVGLAALFHDRQDLNVPVVILRQRLPVSGKLALLVPCVRRSVHHQVKRRGHLLQASQHPPQESRQLLAVRARPWLLKQVVVPPVHHPHFKRHARSIRTQRVVIALHIHNPLALLFFLPHDIAENAAFPVLVPLVRRCQFVLDAPRHENRRGHFRMRVRPLFSRQRPLVLEHAHILESRVLLQVRDSQAPHPQDPLDFIIAQLGEFLVVRPRLDHHFVRAERPHLVVDPFGHPPRLAFHAVQRLRMRNHAPLPHAFRRPRQYRLRAFHHARIQGTLLSHLAQSLALPAYNPALCYGISSNFHGVFIACTASASVPLPEDAGPKSRLPGCNTPSRNPGSVPARRSGRRPRTTRRTCSAKCHR